MKELILEEKKEVITFDENFKKGDYCYGTLRYSEKGWIQPQSFEVDNVVFLCLDQGVRRCNSWTKFEGCFHLCCEEWLKSGNKIYRFNNEKELFKWLSE